MPNDSIFPRTAAPLIRRAPDTGFVAHVEAGTTAEPVTLRNFDPVTKTTTSTPGTFFRLDPTWCASVTRPDLSREQAWTVHVLSWKAEALSVAEAVAEALPADALARLRSDLISRTTPEAFNAQAWWCAAASLLSAEELVAFVGDGRVFAHTYKEGGTSIITGMGDRTRFYDAFFQVVAAHLTPEQWRDVVATVKGFGSLSQQVAAAGNDTNLHALTNARLRLAAVSGQCDDELLELLPAIKAASLDVFMMLFSMRDSAHLLARAERLGVMLWSEEILAKWLDRFGADAPALVVASLMAAPTKKVADPLVAMLIRELGEDPKLPSILEAIVESKAGAQATKWLAKASKRPTAKKPARS